MYAYNISENTQTGGNIDYHCGGKLELKDRGERKIFGSLNLANTLFTQNIK